MARAKFGPLCTEVNGRVGNLIFYVNKAGISCIRQMPNTIKNPCSERQAQMRARPSIFNRAWDQLTDSQRALWGAIADLNYRKSTGEGGVLVLIKGSKEKITDKNAFFQANHLARDVGATTIIASPQLKIPVPNNIVNLNAVFVPAEDGSSAKVTLTWDVPTTATSDHFIRIWMKSRQKLFHKQFVDFAPVLDKTKDILQVRAAEGVYQKMNFFKGGTAYIQVDTVSRSSGWASPPSTTLALRLIKV